MRQPFDSDLLEIFYVVCEQEHLSRAATKLGITTSAVSHAIERLEKNLNEALFLRDRRPLRLTPTGEALLHDCAPLVQSLRSLRERFTEAPFSRPTLRIGLGETVTATVAPWLIGALQNRVKQLKTESNLNCFLSEQLKEGELDICVYSEGLLNESKWKRFPLYEEQYLLITAEGLPKPKTHSDIEQLAQEHPFVTYTKDSVDQANAYRFLRATNIKPRAQIQTSSSYCLVGLIDQAKGWSILPATNLWCGGAFAKTVNWSPIPGKERVVRRMWVLGRDDYSETIAWLASSMKKLFTEKTLPMLDEISPALRDYAYTLN